MPLHFRLRGKKNALMFGGMNTLNDGKAWMATTLGDTPRANSLVKVGQTNGILVTHGRGRGSPPMSPTDYAALICMTLMHDGPTRAPVVVSNLFRLTLSLITLDPGDGTPRDIDVRTLQFADMRDDIDPLVSPYFGKDVMRLGPRANLIVALTALFDGFERDGFARRQDFNRFDRIELTEAHDQRAVTIQLHGPRYGQPWQESPDAHMVKLTFGDIHPGGPGALRTTRTIYGDALNALAATMRGGD